MVKDLKKELSKLSGVDFFNPKYRDVFKKYFPNDTTESELNDNEEDRLKKVLGEENIEEREAQDTQESEETTESEKNKADEDQDENEIEEMNTDTTDEQIESDESSGEEEKTETSDIAEEFSGDEVGDNSETSETRAEEENQKELTTDENIEIDNTSNELLETKIELQLVKSGVREDRLEAAKKLFRSEINSLEDLEKLKELIKEYPEWLKTNKQNAKPFGMQIGDSECILTAEEKRLKALGINPRD